MATDTTGTTSVGITYTPDTTPPAANPSLSPQANAAGWNNTDVMVTWNWTDAAAGVDTTNCTTSGTSTGEGAQLSLTATCTDKAGNQGSASYTVRVDKVPPVVTCPSPAPTFVYRQSGATVSATVTDATSGPVQSLVSASVPTSSVGNLNVSLTGSDTAGNSTSASCPYSVIRAATSTQLTSSLNPAMLGQQATFTATLGIQSPGRGASLAA